MKKLNILLAICITLFGLGFVYTPQDSFVLWRISAALIVAGILLVPAGHFWFNLLNNEK